MAAAQRRRRQHCLPLPGASDCLLISTMERRYLLAALFALLAALLVYWPGSKQGEGGTACPLVSVCNLGSCISDGRSIIASPTRCRP